MKFLRAFAQFWYDFIIGDDWKIAAAVVTAVATCVVLVYTGQLNDALLSVLGGVFIIAAFSTSLAIDVRRHPS